MRRLVSVLAALLLCVACSEPPQKEIDRAQGAIDAARAAGAEQYAGDSFTAATTALREAHDAVEQSDYRLALSRALDASERAQEAARDAADGKAAARSRSESALTATAAQLEQLEGRIRAAEAAKVPAKDLEPVRTAAASAGSALQKARTEIQDGKYVEASESLQGVPSAIEAQIRGVDGMLDTRPSRPARRRSTRN